MTWTEKIKGLTPLPGFEQNPLDLMKEEISHAPTENWEESYWETEFYPLTTSLSKKESIAFMAWIHSLLSSRTFTILKEIEGAKKVGNIGTPGVNFNSGLDKAAEIVRKIAP